MTLLDFEKAVTHSQELEPPRRSAVINLRNFGPTDERTIMAAKGYASFVGERVERAVLARERSHTTTYTRESTYERAAEPIIEAVRAERANRAVIELEESMDSEKWPLGTLKKWLERRKVVREIMNGQSDAEELTPLISRLQEVETATSPQDFADLVGRSIEEAILIDFMPAEHAPIGEAA